MKISCLNLLLAWWAGRKAGQEASNQWEVRNILNLPKFETTSELQSLLLPNPVDLPLLLLILVHLTLLLLWLLVGEVQEGEGNLR